MASNKRVTHGTANSTHKHGARDTSTHKPTGDIIEKLNQLKSLTPLTTKEKTTFKKNIKELEVALKTKDRETILKHLAYFERTLPRLDGKDIVVQEAIPLVLKTRQQFSGQTEEKNKVGERAIKNFNVQGHGMHVGNTQPTETPSFGEDASWLVNSIAKLKTCLTENKDLPQDAFEKGCPKALANAKSDLDSIREEINRRVQTTRETHESFTKKLKDLRESFKRPISEQVQEIERKATTSDPDAKLISDITDLYIGVAKKAEGYSQDLSELHQTLSKPLDVQLDMKSKHTPPVDSYEKVMLKILDIFIEKSKRENEALEKFDKETKGKSVKNEQNIMDPLSKEIEQLLKEIEEKNINNTDYKKRTKKYKPTDTFMNLEKVRDIIADREEVWNNVQTEIEHMTKEIRKQKYDVAGFQKRLKLLKPKEPFLRIEEIRKELEERTTEVEKMKIAVKDLKKHVEEKKFPPEKKPIDTEWETCIADVLRTYKSVLQPGNRQEVWNNVQTEIEHLKNEIENKNYDDAGFQMRIKSLKPQEPFIRIGKIRKELEERTAEVEKMKTAVKDLKRHVEEKTFPPETKRMDTEWEICIADVLRIYKSVLQPDESSDKSFQKIESGIMKMKTVSQTKTCDVNEFDKMEKDENLVVQNIGCVGKRICEWITLDQELEKLRQCIKDEKFNTKRSSTEKENMSSVNDIENFIARLHEELDYVKTEIAGLRKTIVGDTNERSGVHVDTDWKTSLNEIEQKACEYKKGLEEMKKTHVEVNEVSHQLEIMEHRLIASYRSKSTHNKGNDKSVDKRTKSAMGSVTHIIRVMVDEVDNIMSYQESEIKEYQNQNAELRTRMSNLQSEIESIQKVAKSLGAEKDDLVLRLSSLAGAKLTEDNPNIADLSDPNRPTKLAERYREVYDTEWTDAYEELEKARGLGEREICIHLVEILLNIDLCRFDVNPDLSAKQTKSVHTECIEIAKRQEIDIKTILFEPNATMTHIDSTKVLDTVSKKAIIDLRKQTANVSVENVIKGFPSNKAFPKNSKILKYRHKCVEICWYMSLQTPPVVLEHPSKTQGKFNKDRYSEFTRKGSKVDFVTWPPMLLHEGGPLMCKGVAQGK